MAQQFKHHYTPEQARTLLPQVRDWLRQMTEQRDRLQEQERQLQALAAPGRDLGGTLVDNWVRTLTALQDLLLEFYRRDIQIKDLDRGLLDFPTLIDGKEVFLCWELSESDIGYWHDLQAGYAGRRPLRGGGH
jgi:hypothetical protein